MIFFSPKPGLKFIIVLILGGWESDTAALKSLPAPVTAAFSRMALPAALQRNPEPISVLEGSKVNRQAKEAPRRKVE